MTVTLKIEKNVYGGDGLGRMGSGRVAFVPGAFAGETVRAEILAEKKNYVTTRLVEVEEPSPDRVKDVGPVVPGMVYAPVTYAGEMRLKQDQLENFLWKVAPTVLPLEAIPSPQPLNYRNKVVYHTEKRQGKWLLGYRAEPEHRVVDVTEDPLACPAINAALPGIRSSVFSLLTQGARAVRESAKSADNVTIRWTPLDGVKWWLGEPPRDLELREQADGRRFRVGADGFWQVNTAVGDKLVKAVRAAYEEAAGRAPHILDLYCGAGVFGLCCIAANPGQRSGPLAAPNPAQGRLIGIESGRSAVAAAKRNAEALGVKANFFCERVGGSLSRIKVGPRQTVIVDPPRGGLEPNVAPWLANRPAPRIIYVSCDPATLVRDLAALVKRYEIKHVKLLDMFPRTARFETMVVLERKD
ncbi:MAG: class I SAM-dependent RNA methyltransferase [Kiritimatiellae bacterium]|nr:class I SAM-dependent RNA methyltransferase [Kiritimatiellia bacterium]